MRFNFIYRLKQKWNYRIAQNSFERNAAEINRNQSLIFISSSTFKIRDCELVFSKEHHSFIVDRFYLFEVLLKERGKFKIEGNDLLYVIDSTVLRITTSEEIFIIHEIYFERCYNVLAPWSFNVIDIGMNVGFASLFFAGNANVLKVFGYEPFQQTFEDAQSNFMLNPKLAPKIIRHNFGLGLKNERRLLNYSASFKGKNSILTEGGESIELRSASDVFDEVISNMPGHFFVKMDCEGAEFEIFESLLKKPIPTQIFGFIIEWHRKNPQPIVDVLTSNNFRVQLTGNAEIGLITAFR